jgi:hypothetical protein
MKPHSAAVYCAAALIFFVPLAAAAQDAGSQPQAPSDGTDTAAEQTPSNPFLRGEQTLQLNAGLQFPAFLAPVTDQGVSNLKLGGAFSFSYQYFISRGFALGGSISGAFNSTIGGLSVFVAPLGVTAGYWWSRMPFEFCAIGELGGYIMRYNQKGMLGPFAKAGGGVLWRVTSSWSLGLQSFFWIVPELHYGEYADLSQYSGFVETSIAAVYHL